MGIFSILAIYKSTQICLKSFRTTVPITVPKLILKKKDIIISYAKLYYDENKNSLDRTISTNGYACIGVLGDLELTNDELKKTNGNYFDGVVKVSSNETGTVFEYKDRCE